MPNNANNKEVELQRSTTVDLAIDDTQRLDRNFNLLSIISVGVVTGNTWASLGGTITVAIYNGGPPGVLYEL